MTLSAIWHQRQSNRTAETRPRSERIGDRRRLIAAVHHTVRALVVSTGPVTIPIRRLQQLLKRGDIPFLEKIAGLLPAEDIISRIAPRRTLVLTFAHQKIQEQRGLIKTPARFGIGENARKELLRATPFQEILLVGSLLITVSRRNHHAFDAELHHLIEKRAHASRIGIIEQGRVGRHAEAPLESRLNRFHGYVIDPISADGMIVVFLKTIHVNAERQIF